MMQKGASKTKVFAAAGVLLAVILSSMAPVEIADAHFNSELYPIMDFSSPLSAPYIYQNTTLDISFSYSMPKNLTQINSFSYSLDGAANSTLPHTNTSGNYFLSSRPNVYFPNRYTYSKPLDNLANGNHTLSIYAYLENGTVKQIYGDAFTVDTTFQSPQLTIISPLNQTYSTNQVQLNYCMNSQVVWAFYTIDSQEWASLKSNLTLTDLAEGTHTITMSVSSEASQHTLEAITRETIYFTVDTASQKEGSPTDGYLLPATVVTIIAIAIIGTTLLLLLKKRVTTPDHF